MRDGALRFSFKLDAAGGCDVYFHQGTTSIAVAMLRAEDIAFANALAQTSNNSNGVGTLSQGADGSYNQTQMQDGLSKLDELINALRR